MMIDCNKCGEPNDDDAALCINCGEKLHSAIDPAAEPPERIRAASDRAGKEPDPIPGVSSANSQLDQRQSGGFGRIQIINKDLYLENAKKTRRTLSKRLRAYVKDPNPDNVHDLRTAARRTRAYLQLLPRIARRRKGTRKYFAMLDELIRSNASIRDIDIIISKISKRSDNPVYEKLVSRLTKRRVVQLKPALRLASSIKKPPRGLIRPEDMSDELLQKRFDKVTRKVEDRITRRLPIVLENPAKKKALHRLRDDSRRLRYILDLGGTPNKKEPMPVLRSWQDILGLVHDSDIMIDHLNRGKPSPEAQDLLRDEVAERNMNYEKFASMASTQIVLRLSEHRGRKAARRLAR